MNITVTPVSIDKKEIVQNLMEQPVMRYYGTVGIAGNNLPLAVIRQI
jgi:hypothetical protein